MNSSLRLLATSCEQRSMREARLWPSTGPSQIWFGFDMERECHRMGKRGDGEKGGIGVSRAVSPCLPVPRSSFLVFPGGCSLRFQQWQFFFTVFFNAGSNQVGEEAAFIQIERESSFINRFKCLDLVTPNRSTLFEIERSDKHPRFK